MNKVILMGRLGADPQFIGEDDGTKFYNFPMATNEYWTDSNGKKHSKETWHRIVIFNEKLFGMISEFVQKGSQILVEGKLTYRTVLTEDGREQIHTSIVVGSNSGLTLLGSKHT